MGYSFSKSKWGQTRFLQNALACKARGYWLAGHMLNV